MRANMFDNVDLVATKMLSLVAVGAYSFGKTIGAVAASLKDSWHFELLQELAFVAAIVSSIMAVITLHQKLREARRKEKEDKDNLV